MKAGVLARALTSNEYTKIGNFVDKSLPPHAVKRCAITTATQPRSSPSISISELLSRQNRKLLKMVGDGNCFFRAIATLFYGSQEKHADVRNEIVIHIGKTANKFSAFMPQPTTQVQQHITTMRNTGVWATLAEIMAAVELYGVPLYLYTLTPSRTSYHWQCYSPEQPEGHEVRQTPHGHIELAHPMAIHFDVILDGNTGLPSLTPPQLTGKTSIHPDIL